MQANAIYINDAYQPTADKDTKVVTNVATDVQMGMTKELWAKLIAGICLFAAPIAVLVGTFAL